MERWNAIADQCIRRIRQIAPDVDILVGGYWNNSVAAVRDLADAEDALRWYQAIHTVFEEFGIGRAAWNYRGMNFGFVEEHFRGVLGDVIRCL